jgi:hypothetical protein
MYDYYTLFTEIELQHKSKTLIANGIEFQKSIQTINHYVYL